MTTELFLLYGSILAAVGIVLSKAGYRLGIPTLLLFLGVGVFASRMGYIEFNDPVTAQTIGTIALIVILFSGGMDTDFGEIRPVLVPGAVLATVGVIGTAFFMGGFLYYLSRVAGLGHLTFPEALLLGSVMSSTDSASVFSILRSKGVALKHDLKPLLEVESGSNDPMAYMLTIVLVQMIQSGEVSVMGGIFQLVMQFAIGAALGYALGRVSVWFINRVNLPGGAFYPILLLAISGFVFGLTSILGGNGYLAVYISGLVIGNSKMVYRKSSTKFMDGFTWLCQLIMFLSLGLLVDTRSLVTVLVPGLMVALFLMLVARPVVNTICMLPFVRQFTVRGIAYANWVGLRGAVPIIFATYPWVAGLEYAGLFFNIVFVVTIVSLLVQGSTVPGMAKILGVVDERPRKHVFTDVDLPEQVKSTISEMVVSKSMIGQSNKLRDLNIPDHTLAILVQRKGNFFIPRGDTELAVGDHVLVISDNEEALVQAYEELGIQTYSLDSNL